MKKLQRTEKCTLTERVLQFGEGNFLRGFVDWMIDRLNKETDWNGGVVVVQPRAGGHAERLNEQDGLYTLYLRGLQNGAKTEETRVIECITRGINPYKSLDEYLDCAKNPKLRFIVSNTTEAGIEYKAGQTDKDFNNMTFPARLTLFLKHRYELGLSGFIFLPCELIDKNGDALKECILKYARDWSYGGDFENWINSENRFTNTLVDRIVTGYPGETASEMEKQYGYTDSMLDTAEIFHLWVIEGDKTLAEEIPFHKIGLNVIWTDDVTPYKKRKVRILNGAHTMMVLAARLAGLETVRDVMEDPLTYRFMRDGVFEEIIPSLGTECGELKRFAEDVTERFKNPFIKHYLLSIALNSVSKFKVRVLPSILEYRRLYGKNPKRLAFSLAALIEFYRGDEANDAPEVISFMKTASVQQILANTEYWDCDLSFLLGDVLKYVERIGNSGIRQAMAEVCNEND